MVPYAEADTLARAWMLSELSVRQNRIKMPALDAGLAAAVEGAKHNWPKYLKSTPVLVLTDDKDGWAEVAGYPDSSPRYHPRIGLTFGNFPRMQDEPFQ